jgi:hypothetical protein
LLNEGRSSDGFTGGWNSGRARSAREVLSAMHARQRCRPR